MGPTVPVAKLTPELDSKRDMTMEEGKKAGIGKWSVSRERQEDCRGLSMEGFFALSKSKGEAIREGLNQEARGKGAS